MPVWRESSPEANSMLSEFPSTMTTQAVAFREDIEKHLFWTEGSGASAGVPRYSTTSAGACRAFFAPVSSASTALSTTKPLAGRLYIASDTSRLLGYTSDNTLLLGSVNAITFYGRSYATIAAGTRVLVQSSNTSVAVDSYTTVTFPTAYTMAPEVQVMAGSTLTTDFYQAVLYQSGTTNIVLSARSVFGTSSVTCNVWWRSHGSATL